MTTNQNDIDIQLIEKWIDQTLSSAEKTAFENRMNDPEFQSQVEIHKEVIKEFKRTAQNNALKDELRAYVEQRKSAKTKTFIWKNSYAVAAVIALLFISSSIFLGNKYYINYSNHKLFDELFKPLPTQPSYRGTNTSNKINGLHFYYLEQWDKAVEELKKEVANNPSDYTLKLYLANSYLCLGAYKEAKDLLVAMDTDSDSLYKEHIQWYLALAHLGLNDKHQTELIAKKLASTANIYADSAKKLQETMK